MIQVGVLTACILMFSLASLLGRDLVNTSRENNGYVKISGEEPKQEIGED